MNDTFYYAASHFPQAKCLVMQCGHNNLGRFYQISSRYSENDMVSNKTTMLSKSKFFVCCKGRIEPLPNESNWYDKSKLLGQENRLRFKTNQTKVF